MHHTTVRQAVVADIDALASLFDQYRQFQGKAGDIPAARAFLLERMNHGEAVLFLAFDRAGGAPLGFAQLYPSFSSVSLARVFILNDLFVAPAGRRQGVASALLAALEAYAWAFGAARLSLNVARDNVSAQQLYRAQGWQPDERHYMFHRFPAGGGA